MGSHGGQSIQMALAALPQNGTMEQCMINPKQNLIRWFKDGYRQGGSQTRAKMMPKIVISLFNMEKHLFLLADSSNNSIHFPMN